MIDYHHLPSVFVARLLRKCKKRSAFGRPCWKERGHKGYCQFRLWEKNPRW
jgi:hypothetical protein